MMVNSRPDIGQPCKMPTMACIKVRRVMGQMVMLYNASMDRVLEGPAERRGSARSAPREIACGISLTRDRITAAVVALGKHALRWHHRRTLDIRDQLTPTQRTEAGTCEPAQSAVDLRHLPLGFREHARWLAAIDTLKPTERLLVARSAARCALRLPTSTPSGSGPPSA